jgi:hypothetical protein
MRIPRACCRSSKQRAGEKFSQTKVDAFIAALKDAGRFVDVQLEARPVSRGVRVLFVLQWMPMCSFLPLIAPALASPVCGNSCRTPDNRPTP